MSTDPRKVQLGTELDATGVRKGASEVVQETRKMAAGVADAAKPAAAAVDGIGSSGNSAAKKLESSTRSMIGQIQRTTAAMEAGERGSTKYFEALAAQRGVSVEALRPYLQQLDAAKVKQDAAAKSLDGMGTSANLAMSALKGMIAGFSVGMIGAFARETISAAAALDDLAESTGSTVESLSEIKNRLRVAGVDAGTFTTLVNKLAVGLSGLDDESTTAARALANMGITTKDPAEALKQLAIKMNEYADGVNKAGNMQAIFGKGAAQYVGPLKDLAKELQTGATVTGEFASNAEEFEKALNRNKIATEAWANAILVDLLPPLTQLLEMTRGNKVSGLFAWLGITEEDTKNVDVALVKAQQSLDKLIEMRDTLSKNTVTNAINNMIFGDLADVNAQIPVAEARVKALKAMADDITKKILDAVEAGNKKPDAPPPPKKGATVTREEKQAIADYADEIDRLNMSMLKLAGTDGGYEKTNEAANKIIRDVQAGKKVTQEQADAYMRAAAAADALAKAKKAEADEEKRIGELWKTYEKQITDAANAEWDMYQKRLQSNMALKDGNDDIKTEIATLGMSSQEREIYITRLQLSKAETEGNANAVVLLTEKLELLEKRNVGQSAIEFSQKWAEATRSIGDDLTDMFMRAVGAGRDGFKSLISDLSRWFSNLVFRPIIQGVMAPIAGGISSALYGGSAGASGLASGIGSGIGNSLFGGNSLLGIGGIGGLFSGSGGIFGAGAIGNSFAMGSLGQSLGLSTGIMEGLTPFGTALGSAIPLLGVGLAIAGMSGLFSSKGGPKAGGFASTGGVGSDNWSPSDADATLQGVVGDLQTAFGSALKSMGGSGSANFLLGYDTDPQGTANNRLEASSYVNGQRAYHYWSGDDALGRDEAALQARMELEGKRAIVAALAASDLPQQIAAVFNAVDPAAMDSAAIDNLLAFGAAMRTVIDAIGGSVIEDANTAWEKANRTSTQTIAALGDEVIRLAGEMDGSVESMQALSTATSEYRAAVVQTLVAIKGIAQQIDEMFGTTRDSLEMFGMSPDQLYDRYRKDADIAYQQLLGASDPETVKALAEKINADIQAAFGVLPDDLKLAQQNPLIAYLDAVNASAQARLAVLSSDISSGTETPFAAASAALTDAAPKFAEAAQASASAANVLAEAAQVILRASSIQLQAAQTPITVNVGSGYAETNG